MSYQKVNVNLTEPQKKHIHNSSVNDTTTSIKLKASQLHSGPDTLLVTGAQMKKINKCKASGKGMVLNFSRKQISAMKKGGFLPMILASLVGSLAPMLFGKLFGGSDNSQSASGIPLDPVGQLIARNAVNSANQQRAREGREQVAMPDFSGREINMPGSGFIHPANGENTSYHINGFSAANAGQGAGLVLPGTTRGRGSKKQLEMPGYGMDLPEYRVPVNKKKKISGQQGMCYMIKK